MRREFALTPPTNQSIIMVIPSDATGMRMFN
jgi:hypothetical protein